MELNVAIQLIQPGIEHTDTPQTWADLGAGAGLFTHAIASQLPAGSTVYAVDQRQQSLDQIQFQVLGISIQKQKANLETLSFETNTMDGFLLANALHFVFDKQALLTLLRSALRVSGRIIIVEYDTNQANQWVPYPIAYKELQKLVKECGFSAVDKIGEAPSIYHNGGMYAAVGFK